MDTEKKLRAAIAYSGLSISEVARRVGTSPQNFGLKLKRDTFTNTDLEKISKVLGCVFRAEFEFPDGTKI